MAKQIILIAGNICAGKTELGKYIEENKALFEPFLAKGEEVTSIPEFIDPVALELFYENMKEHSVTFEESCLRGRINRHLMAKQRSGIYIFDRGMIEGAETFCKNSFQEDYLSREDYENYLRNIERGLDQLDRTKQEQWLEQIVVYLRVSSEEILVERQKNRDTANETIPIGYLIKINKMYETLFGNVDLVYSRYGLRAPKVITIDATQDFTQDKGYHPRILDSLIQSLGKMQDRN
jgi:deoxyadenosine/deoxycytidine kinase